MQFKSVLHIVVTLVCTIFVLFTLYVKQILEKKKQKLIIENLNLYNEMLRGMYDGVRSMKHDFVNFVQALNGYVQCNDMDGVRTMTYSMCKECKKICNMEELNPKIINNPAVYNLIANKYQLASNKNIEMNIEIACDLQEIDLDTYQLCKILGILIDNAIEATCECKNRVINIRMIKEDDSDILIVENSYENKEVDVNKIYEKGYTTKLDGFEHGLGLWEVKEIVGHVSNVEMNTSKGDLFRQELRIKGKNKNFAISFKSDKMLLKQK